MTPDAMPPCLSPRAHPRDEGSPGELVRGGTHRAARSDRPPVVITVLLRRLAAPEDSAACKVHTFQLKYKEAGMPPVIFHPK